MNTKRILFLDYLRVLSFVTVIIGHKYGVFLRDHRYDETLHVTLRHACQILYSICAAGALGVVLFFMISGYIISYVLKNESVLEFYIKRFFRIYPLYMFAVLCETVYLFYSKGEFLGFDILLARLFLVGDFFQTPPALAGVEWTLRIEVLFYIVMGLLKAIGITRNGNYLTVTSLVIGLALWKSSPFPAFTSFHYGYLSAFTPFLFIGVIIYLLDTHKVNLLLAIFSIVTLFYIHLDFVSQYIIKLSTFSYGIYGMIIFPLACYFKDYFTYNHKIFILSEITYPVYLFHNWAWDLIKSLLEKMPVTFLCNGITIVTVLLVVCYFMNKHIEKNANRLGRKLAKRITSRSLITPPKQVL